MSENVPKTVVPQKRKVTGKSPLEPVLKKKKTVESETPQSESVVAKHDLTTIEGVHACLKELGVEDPEKVSGCLKSGILHGYVDLNVEDPLGVVVAKGKCLVCRKKNLCATVKHLLGQPDCGSDHYDGGGWKKSLVKCQCLGKDYPIGFLVRDICSGRPRFTIGKDFKHCKQCPDFGICLGDHRECHCEKCGRHFRFSHQCCEEKKL